MGPPGVGKGTQSRRLSELLGAPVIASGDMFRAIRGEETPLAQEVRRYMDRGEYVPDELTIKLVLDRLNQPDARRGFILDGFPRTVPQAEALDQALEGDGRRIDHVVLLEAPFDVVLARLSGRWTCGRCGRVYNETSNPPKVAGVCDTCGAPLIQRTDEAPGVQRHRLQVFAQQTEPVADFYRKSGRLQTVDAQKSVAEVTAEIEKIMNQGVGAH